MPSSSRGAEANLEGGQERDQQCSPFCRQSGNQCGGNAGVDTDHAHAQEQSQCISVHPVSLSMIFVRNFFAVRVGGSSRSKRWSSLLHRHTAFSPPAPAHRHDLARQLEPMLSCLPALVKCGVHLGLMRAPHVDAGRGRLIAKRNTRVHPCWPRQSDWSTGATRAGNRPACDNTMAGTSV